MTKIDIVSGFLGAGKTTLIKKLLKEALAGTQTVLIENEFGEIGIDGGFLKDAGIEIKEMNSGCICCSLVGDFGTSLKEVLNTYHPDRILIEPSGVGKLSDVMKAVQNAGLGTEVELNSAVAVVDASKCKMYIKNFGEFFINQIEHAGTIILSRTDVASEEKVKQAVELIREHNEKATIITTPLAQLEGSQTEAAEANAAITGQMTELKTAEAALEAERGTALTHIADLQNLRAAMEGDREKKEALADAIREDTHRLEGEIAQLKIKQEENDAESDRMNALLRKTQEDRAEAEASKTRAERDAQEKNKDILNMERACALLEQKKVTSSMEEKQIVDKLWDSYGLTPGTAPEHRGQIENVTAGNRRAAELKRKIAALGTPNLGAIEEYARVNERYTYLASQRDDVLTSKRELESVIRDITKEMTTIFVSEFGKIDHYFGQTFEEMFGGGKGQLILEDPENPLTCGIEIRVQPPGKQVKTITLLSGGEKAFVATALYFAILKVRPTPFCLLDEIDAALDDRNVERFASYLHNLAKKTQFIVITHRRGTMEASDVLYGVTMQEQGVSKLLRLDLNQMEEYLGIVE